jgi:hypothetical protein
MKRLMIAGTAYSIFADADSTSDGLNGKDAAAAMCDAVETGGPGAYVDLKAQGALNKSFIPKGTFSIKAWDEGLRLAARADLG